MSENIRLSAVRFGADGLVPVVTQESRSGDVLMVAYANREALDRTLATGLAHYFSRSRGVLWQKGETSTHVQRVLEVRLDCDGDAVLYRVEQSGPACHTGTRTCFSTVIRRGGGAAGQRERRGGGSRWAHAEPAGADNRSRAADRPRARIPRNCWPGGRQGFAEGGRGSSRGRSGGKFGGLTGVSRPRRPISSIIFWCSSRLAASRWMPCCKSWNGEKGVNSKR